MKKFLLYTFFALSLFLAINILLYYFFKISLAGYCSDVILFWLWLISSFAVIILFWKKLGAKLFLGTIVLALVVSFIAMMIPFFAILLSMTSAGLYQEKTLNKNYRAQIVRYDAMARPQLELIKKKGFLEKRISVITDLDLMTQYPDIEISHAKDIIFRDETDNTLEIALFYGGPNIFLTLDKATGKLLKIE